MISGISVLILAAVLTVCYLISRKHNKKYPPGPWGLPILGHIFSIGTKPHISYVDLGKKYGPIFTANMGPWKGVVIEDLDMIKEMYNNPLFSGRPDMKAFNILAGGKHGIISSDGDEWLEQRRFTLRQLRDFGFGKKNMEALIMEEVEEFLDWLRNASEKPVSVNRKFSLSVLNSLWQILTGQRFHHDDPELNKIMDTATETFNDISGSPIALFFPWLAEKFPNFFGWTKVEIAAESLLRFFRETIEKHEKSPADPAHPRDFIDVYFNEINKTTKQESSFYKEAGKKSLLAVVGDLHGAGSETTSATLAWTILYLLKHPKVQAKLQKEIDDIIGRSRLPCLADKPSMPYAESVMYETLRMSSLAPVGLFHTAMADTEFHGYFIAKDTMMTANHYSVHYNPKIWGDPESFRPERFLSPDGKTATKHEALIPFGYGKRACLGETLARDGIFLFMTSIFQQFEAVPDPANPDPTLEPDAGFLLVPQKYTVVMKERIV